MSRFLEVADRVWVARDEQYGVTTSVIGGTDGLLVVDTGPSAEAAQRLLAGLRTLSSLPLVGVVNTHHHSEHVGGNGALRSAFGPVPVTAHEYAAAQTEHDGAQRTFSSVLAIDLGDRSAELIHPGRGHTAGDLVVRLEDADVLLAGDLLAESGNPVFGEDCHPMDWPSSLDLVLSLVGAGTVIVPGHGAHVDRDFATEQRSAIGVVAETIRDLAGRGVPLSQALTAAEWPYPAEDLSHAVSRAYEQLPRMARQLPLV